MKEKFFAVRISLDRNFNFLKNLNFYSYKYKEENNRCHICSKYGIWYVIVQIVD